MSQLVNISGKLTKMRNSVLVAIIKHEVVVSYSRISGELTKCIFHG
jgi:hypothetical protein